MIAALGGGLALTGLVTGILWGVWGEAALAPGFTFGGLATGIQVASAGLMRRARHAEFRVMVRRWGVGMGMRVGGIVLFGLASWFWRAQFPPLPTAFAYLGVVVPLLFLEIRFLR